MLVLTRKTAEKIQIGDNVTITILRVKGQAVRVGIDAPRDVRIVRTELPVEGPGAEDTEEESHPVATSLPRSTPGSAPLAGLVATLSAG